MSTFIPTDVASLIGLIVALLTLVALLQVAVTVIQRNLAEREILIDLAERVAAQRQSLKEAHHTFHQREA